jgi:uncharacterized Zn-binding protein involved in type VI secretion
MKKTLLAVVAVVVLAISGFAIYNATQNDTSSDQAQTEQTEQQPAGDITFSEDGKTVTFKGQEGTTALATLESLTTVTTQDSDFGRFVTGINGVEADSTTQYWAFYVNGEMANEGAGTYEAGPDDTFEFRLEDL